MPFCRVGESWEEYCKRRALESQESVRLYRGMAAVIPLLQETFEPEGLDLVLGDMAIRDPASARQVLVNWLHEHCKVDRLALISSALRAFDVHSV